ncbi:MAG: sensor protein [Gemmatimonadetes bacterium]|nr:sensor protein [Gemmatimonadota bacterium]
MRAADSSTLPLLTIDPLLGQRPQEVSVLDRIARVAATALATPSAVLSLVVDGELKVWSVVGIPAHVAVPRGSVPNGGLCERMRHRGEPLLLPDLRELNASWELPPVLDELGVRAYAGVPVTVATGEVVGTLCVLDFVARHWTESQLSVLTDLASLVVTELEREQHAAEAQRAREALARRGDEFFTLAEHAPDVIVRFGSDLRVQYINPAVEKLGARPRDGYVGRLVSEIAPPAFAAWWDGILQEALASGAGRSVEFDVAIPAGGSRRYHALLTPEPARGEALASVLVIFYDVSDRWRAGALLRTLQSLSSAMAQAPTLAAAMRVALDRSLAITGWRVGLVWTLADDGERLVCAAARATSEGGCEAFISDSMSRPVRRDEGLPGRIWESGAPVLIRDLATEDEFQRRESAAACGLLGGILAPIFVDGALVGVLECYFDDAPRFEPELLEVVAVVTAQLGVLMSRQQVQERVSWQDSLLRSVAGAAPVGLLVVNDALDEILYSNGLLWTTWRLEASGTEHAAGTLDFSTLAARIRARFDAPAEFDLHAFVAATGDDSSRERRVALADGRTIRVVVTPMRDERGASRGRLVLFEDITVRARAQREMLQSQKMEALGRMAGGVAHDFNNMLTAITSYSEFVLEDLPEESPIRADVIEIKQAAGRAAELTRQLLAFSRHRKAEQGPLQVNDVIAGVEQLISRVIGAEITVTTQLESGIPVIIADGAQLEQVVMNLALNARDAMPAGGTLRIDTLRRRLALPHAGVLGEIAPGDYACIVVRDSGVGMDEVTRSRIFEPFFTTKPVGQATGLGLATVYGILRQHEGNIEVHSAPGAGSMFTAYLPVAEGAGPEVAPRPMRPASGAGSETILLVEDESSVRRLGRRVLEARGYTVLEAANAGEALVLCERHEAIDLLLTDVIMPMMNGRELAERVRALRPGIAVMFMSGYTATLLQDIDPERESFIAKPFSPDELGRAVRATLDAAGPVRDPELRIRELWGE